MITATVSTTLIAAGAGIAGFVAGFVVCYYFARIFMLSEKKQQKCFMKELREAIPAGRVKIKPDGVLVVEKAAEVQPDQDDPGGG